jgi:indoleamine 2,3-dioxygenase
MAKKQADFAAAYKRATTSFFDRMSAVPKLEDYDVFPDSGFLPQQAPLVRLPQAYYAPWEDLANTMPAMLLARRVRRFVNESMPLLDTDKLAGEEQFRRAYQCLTFIAHGYVWGDVDAVDVLPPQVATPLVAVSEHLGLPPLATYALLCLWNFKEIVPTQPFEFRLDNLTTINTFTGSMDELWFYLVSVAFERDGARCLEVGLQAMGEIERGGPLAAAVPRVTRQLQELAETIDYLGSVLLRMEEMCDPHVFYYRIRPYLAGWKGMGDVGLSKDGVLYGHETRRRNYAGGSNAQLSLIQYLDILLGVHHYATGDRRGDLQPANSFMNDQRNYMPRQHRQFLAALEQAANINAFVNHHRGQYPELELSYDACLAMLKAFRDKHIQIVTRYVVLQARNKDKMGSTSTMRSGLAKKGVAEKGTGGTSLLPFLKQCRDETGDPAAGNWGKRILSDGVMRLKYSKSNGVNEE